MPIENKKILLKKIKNNCIEKSKQYLVRYKRLKKIDDIIDIIISFLNSANIACLISGLSYPPILFASIACSSVSFIISRAQQSYNFKHRYTTHNNTVNNYNELIREITNRLYRNHLSNEQLEDFIEYINSKLDIIENTSIL